ncbi:MAG: aminopeptidase P family protein [Acidimicrobiia bacterium]|nr:aminopeptidase P family protein [Acidimicrobiia bacterium]
MFPDADYSGRLDRARALMDERDADVMLLSVGADLPYFAGYEAMPLERLTMLVVPKDAGAVLVVPRLEAPRIALRGGAFEVWPWDELDDPVGVVARHAGKADLALIGEQTWSRFLLELQRTMHRTRFESASAVTRQLRMRKDAAEIELLRAAAAATDRVVAALDGVAFGGRTERDLAAEVQRLVMAEGHDIASFAIIASGPNAASPHHEPTDRMIEEGDTVVVDFGGRWHGYCSDTTRTFVVGEPSPEIAAAHSVLEAAQAAGRAAVRPGATGEDVDAAARKVIDAAGYGDHFIHRTGHGIGLEVHEHPYIVAGNSEPLEAGMTFSIEPGIYLPGRFGMRIEDIVACSTDGIDELNRSPRTLHEVS